MYGDFIQRKRDKIETQTCYDNIPLRVCGCRYVPIIRVGNSLVWPMTLGQGYTIICLHVRASLSLHSKYQCLAYLLYETLIYLSMTSICCMPLKKPLWDAVCLQSQNVAQERACLTH